MGVGTNYQVYMDEGVESEEFKTIVRGWNWSANHYARLCGPNKPGTIEYASETMPNFTSNDGDGGGSGGGGSSLTNEGLLKLEQERASNEVALINMKLPSNLAAIDKRVKAIGYLRKCLKSIIDVMYEYKEKKWHLKNHGFERDNFYHFFLTNEDYKEMIQLFTNQSNIRKCLLMLNELAQENDVTKTDRWSKLISFHHYNIECTGAVGFWKCVRKFNKDQKKRQDDWNEDQQDQQEQSASVHHCSTYYRDALALHHFHHSPVLDDVEHPHHLRSTWRN